MAPARASAGAIPLKGSVALFLLLRGVFFVGHANVDPWDDTNYLRAADEARRGEWGRRLEAFRRWDGGIVAPQTQVYVRPGFVFPLALAQRLAGVNEVASALPSLVASLGGGWFDGS